MRQSPVFALALALMSALLAIASCVFSPEQEGANEAMIQLSAGEADLEELLIATTMKALERKLVHSADPCVLVGVPVSSEQDPEICYRYEIVRIEDGSCVEAGFYLERNPRSAAQGAPQDIDDALLSGASDALLAAEEPLVRFKVYEHANYYGSVLWVYTDFNNLKRIPRGKDKNWNDVISSVKYENGPGTLYEHIGNNGRKLPINSGEDYKNLTNYAFNDITSSIKLTNVSAAGKDEALRGKD